MKRHWRAEDAPDKPESSKRRDVDAEDRANESQDVEDPILRPDHKIFLSHSGAQKEFVEQLCRDLENCYHFPFFDRRPSSLPKGERFPELILKAARQCQMAVVVVSEEYFSSKWPMIELNAFVQARLLTMCGMIPNPNLKILPLFYQLSVQEFCDERRRDRWFSIWEDLAEVDSRINVGEWKESLKVLASFNGIPYNRASREAEAYREKIVSSICKEIPPEIKFDDSHFQGRSVLCKELRDKIDQIRAVTKKGFCLIGIYGVGGIGKTTMCKILCNELFQEMKGNVSHVEFGSGTYKELLMKVLKDLTSMYKDVIQQCEEDQCKHILSSDIGKHKVFLAIDNVWSDSKSIEEAKVYLQAHFHEESIVMVTSRSLETLTFLGIDESHCFEMPNLGYVDALNLFLHHAAYGTKVSSYSIEDMRLIEKCIALCYFCKGKHSNGHYLPLALKAVGVQLGCIGRCPLKWVEALPKVRDFNYLQEEENPVFNILRSSFDRLLPMHQALFLDLAVYSPIVGKWTFGTYDWTIDDWRFGNAMGLIEWLSIVHNKEIHDIESQLQHLKGRGLVEDVDIALQRVYIHELYREFAKFESKGNLEDSSKFEKKSWVYYEDAYPTELEMMPSNRCWQNLKRIRILESRSNLDRCVQIESMQDIEWSYFSNVVVLKLDELVQLRGELNLKGLKCLRSLDIMEVNGLDSLDGLQDLNNLTYFKWITNERGIVMLTRIGKLPSSLKILHLNIGVWLRPDMFACCTKLSKVNLRRCRAEKLDLSQCASLQSLTLEDVDLALDDSLGLIIDESLELHNRTIFKWEAKWTPNCWDVKARQQIPEMLKVLDVETLLRAVVFAHDASMSKLELMRCRVVNLHFHNCASLRSAKLSRCCFEKLDFKNCPLKAIMLQDVSGLGTIDWLQNRSFITYKENFCDKGKVYERVGQLPASLETLVLSYDGFLVPNVFACCTNLVKIELRKCRAKKLDFSQCASLHSLTLEDFELALDNLLGLSDAGSEELNDCTFFKLIAKWTPNCWDVKARQQIRKMLKVLDVETLLRAVVFAHDAIMSKLELMRCRVVNLHFHNCASLQGAELSGCCFEKLDIKNCPTLRTIILRDVNRCGDVFGLSKDRLQDLNNLSSISGRRDLYDNNAHVCGRVGQLPASLEDLKVDVHVLFRQDVFSWCSILRKVNLMKGRAKDMDFSNCKALESVKLGEVQGVETLLGLQKVNNLSCFSLSLKWEADHLYLRIIEQMPASIEVLKLNVDVPLELDVFGCLTNLREVDLTKCRAKKLDFSNNLALQKVSLDEIQGLQIVVGLENLKYLTYFSLLHTRSHNSNHICPRIMGQFPVSLEVLELCVDVSLISDMFAHFAHCTNLRKRHLWRCQA